MVKRKDVYVATMRLVRDPGFGDAELVRTLSDWKRLKDGGANPPEWSRETPDTLDGFVRLLANSGPASVTKRKNEVMCAMLFEAAAGWTDVMAQAFSSIAFGLRPGLFLDVSCLAGHRRFGIVRNGDGEPEVEEVDPDA